MIQNVAINNQAVRQTHFLSAGRNQGGSVPSLVVDSVARFICFLNMYRILNDEI